MVTSVSLSYVALSYLLALLLELTRWIFSMRYRIVMVACATIVGISLHLLYLVERVVLQWQREGSHAILGSWYDWSLLAGLGLAAIYLFLILRRPESPYGTFLLPLILLLMGISLSVRNQPSFDRQFSYSLAAWVHGVSLMVGMMLVALGFAMAIMYLVQAWSLKRRMSRVGRLRLPSLEYLQAIGSWTLFASAASLACGLASGVLINLQRSGRVGWTEPGILFSGGLFVWLSLACALQWRWQRRGLGKWTAWLNLGSFCLTILAFLLVVGNPHGRQSMNLVTPPAGEETP